MDQPVSIFHIDLEAKLGATTFCKFSEDSLDILCGERLVLVTDSYPLVDRDTVSSIEQQAFLSNRLNLLTHSSPEHPEQRPQVCLLIFRELFLSELEWLALRH